MNPGYKEQIWLVPYSLYNQVWLVIVIFFSLNKIICINKFLAWFFIEFFRRDAKSKKIISLRRKFEKKVFFFLFRVLFRRKNRRGAQKVGLIFLFLFARKGKIFLKWCWITDNINFFNILVNIFLELHEWWKNFNYKNTELFFTSKIVLRWLDNFFWGSLTMTKISSLKIILMIKQ